MQRSLSPRGLILAILPVLVLMAGCGSSKPAATSSSNPTAPLPAGSTRSGSSSTSSGQRTTTTTSSTTSSPTAPGATTTSKSNPTGGAGLPSGSSSGGATNARVPATFTIGSGGRLSPPAVSAPAFLAVQLTVVSQDSRSHQVLVRTPTPHPLAVPAHGHASVLIPGLRAGRYPLEIDGASRGALSIGGEPGP